MLLERKTTTNILSLGPFSRRLKTLDVSDVMQEALDVARRLGDDRSVQLVVTVLVVVVVLPHQAAFLRTLLRLALRKFTMQFTGTKVALGKSGKKTSLTDHLTSVPCLVDLERVYCICMHIFIYLQ